MQIIPIPCGFDNYAYLLICEQTGVASVIDPTEAYPVLQKCTELGVELQAVLCTHHHHDHIGGIDDLLEEQPDLVIYGYRGDAERIGCLTRPVDDEDLVEVGNLQGRVMFTPGHTSGSICYHFHDDLFVGDTLFGAGCGRLFEGTAEQMHASLMSRIAVLPGGTRLYFGHEYTEKNLLFAKLLEPHNTAITDRLNDTRATISRGEPSAPSLLSDELETNPFLRCATESIKKSVGIPQQDLSEIEVFALIRQQRNSF